MKPASIHRWRAAALCSAIASGCDENGAARGGALAEQTSSDDGDEPPAVDDCDHGVHRIGEDIAVLGCARQARRVRTTPAPDPATIGELRADAGVLVEPGKRLHDCTWQTFTDSAQVMMVTCPDGSHVVSGGCLSQTPMMASAPWEHQTIGDLPEDGEHYQDVTDDNGWLCIYAGPGPSGQIATALCCE